MLENAIWKCIKTNGSISIYQVAKRMWTKLNKVNRQQLENLPPGLLQDLLEACMAVTPPDEMVRYSQIACILKTTQLDRLSLWNFHTTARDFSWMMRKTRGRLKELEVDRVSVHGRTPEIVARALHSVDRLIEANCVSLTRVTLGVHLNDLLILSALRRLEQLTLNFRCAYQLNEIIVKNRNRDYIWPRLRIFRYGDLYSAPTLRFICHLLEKCPLLNYLASDVSEALIRLHETEFLNDGISKKYKCLEKVSLGCLVYGSEQGETRFRVASMISVQIAIDVFPNLSELDIILDNHDCIAILNQFVHLARLRIKWIARYDLGDYSRSLQMILFEIGCQLHELCLHGFNGIDIQEISSLCPHLDSLGIIECASLNHSGFKFNPFEKLKRFRFVPPTHYTAERADGDFLTLINGSEDLEQFIVEFLRTGEDLMKLVCEVLLVNSLKRVFMAGLHFRFTPTDGLREAVEKLVSACEQLRFLTVGHVGIMDFLRLRFPRIKTQYELLYVGL
ncbi:uncharacterized protein LOC108864453 [Galendromus occidentalis]|uniref:Uncharacterized protein LOC108864453 n=1 Tax=Galendromus occidentalis TaxID=34638 RepID=A0AAJ7SFD5_9ACAR|nr:uncharacterized protein LOC108864453 [Galendromus occidentalis]